MCVCMGEWRILKLNSNETEIEREKERGRKKKKAFSDFALIIANSVPDHFLISIIK